MIMLRDTHDYGFEVPACSRRDLVNHAHAVHQVLGYKGWEPFPILELVEHVFPLVYDDYSFDVVDKGMLGEKFGQTYPDKHLIMIREDVYEMACKGDGFARQTVGHEAGHQLRHEGIPISMARREATRELPAYKSSEWQANAMAGALLMPACRIISMNYEEIASIYKVSITAAMTQKDAIVRGAEKWPIPQL